LGGGVRRVEGEVRSEEWALKLSGFEPVYIILLYRSAH
jgi:hypothetical protein